MALLQILEFPDPRLRTRAQPVAQVDAALRTLIDDMFETMYAAPGIGLAAPQVGVSLQIFVIDLSLGKDPAALHSMINPQFIERDGMQLEEEGCLSVPGFTATVARPKRVVVEGLNRHGEKYRLEGTGLLARALQHEVDHLHSCLFVDRLRGISRDLILRKIKKLSKAGKW
jgi:peptide deformylase